MAMTKELDLVGAVVAIVLGILLILGTLSLELVLGVILLVVGLLALARRL
ncbi:MAG: hypothetical protein ACPHK8_07350 [Thermoplasmatota archaeon]